MLQTFCVIITCTHPKILPGMSCMHVEVTLPGARPPAESKKQVIATGFLQQVDRRKGKTYCFFDGSKAWAGECRRLDIMFRQVSHQDHEYAKHVATTPLQLSNWEGTQAMDRWWQALKKFIPATLNRKRHVKKVTVLHPHVALLLYQWVWRTHVARGKSPPEVLCELEIFF